MQPPGCSNSPRATVATLLQPPCRLTWDATASEALMAMLPIDKRASVDREALYEQQSLLQSGASLRAARAPMLALLRRVDCSRARQQDESMRMQPVCEMLWF